LNEEDLTLRANQTIFHLCREFIDNGETIDLLRLRDVLEERNLLDKVGGVAYLAEISDGVVSLPSHQQHLMAKLKACTLRRTLLKLGNDLAKSAAECRSDPQQLVEVLTAEVSSLRNGNLYVEASDGRWAEPQPLDGQLPPVLPCGVENVARGIPGSCGGRFAPTSGTARFRCCCRCSHLGWRSQSPSHHAAKAAG
jgi:hypothetical protein